MQSAGFLLFESILQLNANFIHAKRKLDKKFDGLVDLEILDSLFNSELNESEFLRNSQRFCFKNQQLKDIYNYDQEMKNSSIKTSSCQIFKVNKSKEFLSCKRERRIDSLSTDLERRESTRAERTANNRISDQFDAESSKSNKVIFNTFKNKKD